MDDYTPTTEEVRSGFRYAAAHRDGEALGGGAFDRWLAARDAERDRVVAERAWDEGWAALAEQERLQRADRFHPITRLNPYRLDPSSPVGE